MTQEEIDELIMELQEFQPENVDMVRSALEAVLRHLRKKYPYYDLLTLRTGKEYGDAVEEKIIASFSGFEKPINDKSFDAWTSDREKVEIKSLRAITRPDKHKDEGKDKPQPKHKRICLRNETISPSKLSTSSYQQTKPGCCDWFLFHILYGDASRMFVVPSCMISKHPGADRAEPGKIPLSIQHRDHNTEGQVNLCRILELAPHFEVDYSLEKTYDFSEFAATIKTRMKDIDWFLPG